MEENVKKKKKKKKYYYQNQNKNYYYYRKKKRKNNEKQENILLSNNKFDKVVEEDVMPIKKEDMHNKALLKNVLKISFVSVLLIVIVFKVSYSFFTYQSIDDNHADIYTGEVYVKLLDETSNININRMYPETDEEARSRDDNYFDFTIKSKNTSSSNVIYYNIEINDSNNIPNKTRINKEYIKLDLLEEIDGNYTCIKEGIKLSEYSFVGIIPVNTNQEVVHKYRVRLWISDEIIISDDLENATYTQDEYSNLYANYSIKINSYDGKQ